MSKRKPASSDPKGADDRSEIDFESSLNEVEQIVSHLEGGELGLTESLQQYELGIRQLKRCHSLLDAAEQRVSLLSGFDADGNPVTEPMPVSKSADREPAKKKVRRKKRVAPSVTSAQGDGKSKNDALPSNGDESDSVDDSPGLF